MFEHVPPYVWLIILVAVSVLLPYIAGPFLVRQNVTNKVDPDLVPFPPDHPSLPADVADNFDIARQRLNESGFEAISGFGLPRQMPRVKAVLLLFANRATKEAAMATAIYADLPEGGKLKAFYIEVISLFRDGTLVQTNNCSVLGSFPRKAGVHTVQLPQVRDIGLLVRIHRVRTEPFGGISERKLRLDEEFRGDARAYLAACMREELERQIPTGYMFLSEAEGLFRPTWKGAFLMTWKQLFPFKQVRAALRDRKANALLAELKAQGKLDS
jgi:hypothetical protein